MVQALLIGFVSSVALSGLGLACRVWLDLPYPPQVLFDRLTHLLGTPAVFQFVHSLFGYGQAGKIAAFVGVILAWLGGLSLLGLAPPLVATAAVLVAAGLLVPLPWALAYAALYLGLRLALRPLPETPGRRRTLGLLGGGSLLLGGGGGAALARSLTGPAAPGPLSAAAAGALPAGITSQEDLYYISKNLEAFDPRLKEADWRLTVSGLVRTPTSFSLADLKKLEPRDVEMTLACISNPVGGVLIGNAVWTGFPVRALLDRVGVGVGARHIVWKAADGYVESLPLGQALEEDVLLVYGINGEPLNARHGFPLRVLIPGRYGMKQPRWITEISLSATEPASYWAERGWSRTAVIQTLSRFDWPEEGKPVAAGAPLTVRGIAFAGPTPISRVEVSTDGGRTRREAALTPPRSRNSWTPWSLPWTPSAGSHRLTVRAYANGKLQNTEERDALPEAASGLHKLVVYAS